MMEELDKRCSSDGASFQMPDPNLTSVLEGLVNFSRASKSFRQLLMQACDDLLPALHFLLSKKVARDTPMKYFTRIRHTLATLIAHLSFSTDSQGRMIEKGILGLFAGICETEKYEQDGIRPTVTCSIALLRLLESPDCVNKMRQADVLSILEPYSRVLDAGRPGLWGFIKGRLALTGADMPGQSPADVIPKEVWKAAKAHMCSIDTVCSWEGCGEQVVLSEAMELSKCGRCAVAHYCRYAHLPPLSLPEVVFLLMEIDFR
jgi:hypothetical protein